MRLDPKQADLVWTTEGDIMINDGFMLDTKNQAVMHLYQSVRDRITSSVGDWKYFPNKGTRFQSLLGKPLDGRTEEELRQVLTASLTQDRFLGLGEFNITISSDNKRIMSVTLDINSKRLSSRMQIAFTYDARENRVALRSI
jgi:hypothetical protein